MAFFSFPKPDRPILDNVVYAKVILQGIVQKFTGDGSAFIWGNVSRE